MDVPLLRTSAAVAIASILTTSCATAADSLLLPPVESTPEAAPEVIEIAAASKPFAVQKPRVFASGPLLEPQQPVIEHTPPVPFEAPTAAPPTIEAPDSVDIPPPSPEPDLPPSAPLQTVESHVLQSPPITQYYQSAPVYQSTCVGKPTERNWLQVETLVWWTSDVSVPVLATTSPLGTPGQQAGVLGQDTQNLFGSDGIFGFVQGGFRVRGGRWGDDCGGSGFTADFLMLASKGDNFSSRSNGDLIVARPFNDVGANAPAGGTPNSQLVAYPGLNRGSLNINAETRMYGIGLHWWGELYEEQCRCDGCTGCGEGCGSRGCSPRNSDTQLGLKLGPRFYHLDDTMLLDERFTSIQSGRQYSLRDSFKTENSFLGGEIGLRARRARGALDMELGLNLAIGATHQELDIRGSNSLTTPQGVTTRSSGGFFAQESNIGSTDRTRFSLVPGLEVALGYKLRNDWRATLGYNLMYWTNVLRAGEQIDPSIDPAYFPPNANPAVGMNRPGTPFEESDYLAHGISFGIEKRW